MVGISSGRSLTLGCQPFQSLAEPLLADQLEWTSVKGLSILTMSVFNIHTEKMWLWHHLYKANEDFNKHIKHVTDNLILTTWHRPYRNTVPSCKHCLYASAIPVNVTFTIISILSRLVKILNSFQISVTLHEFWPWIPYHSFNCHMVLQSQIW